MSLKEVPEIDRLVATRVVVDLLAAGYLISVNDGEETTLVASNDEAAICEAMGTVDEDWLTAHKDGRNACVFLVYGNGCDVVCDCSVSLVEVLQPAQEYAEKFSS
jgi:hypothetical protein